MTLINCTYKKNKIYTALAMVLLCAPNYALSQTASDEQEIEVVVITAQKRVQNILKVPISVGTVSDDLIKETGSTTLSDVAKYISGFETINTSLTQPSITMRGVKGPNISVAGDPSTATFFDDMYMPQPAQSVLFSDIERIEILKGPQGTLFGRNAAMGVINVVPKLPTDDTEGFVKLTLGTDSLKRLEMMGNIALADDVFLRANFMNINKDGFIDNISRAEWNKGTEVLDPLSRDHQTARLSLLWNISTDTKFKISVDWDKLEQGPPMSIGTSKYAYGGGKDPFASKVENDVKDGIEERDMYGMIAKIEHDFSNDWAMKYILGYREWETNNREDNDGTSDITRYFSSNNHEDSNILYSELQFNYAGENVNAVTGFSYSHEKVKQVTDLTFTTNSVVTSVTKLINDAIKSGVAEQLKNAIGGDSDAHAAAAFGAGVTFEGAVAKQYSQLGLPVEHIWDPTDWAKAINAMGKGADIMNALNMPGQQFTAAVVSATGDITYDMASAMLQERRLMGPSHANRFWRESVTNVGTFTNWGIYGDIDYEINQQWHVIGGLRYSKDRKDISWLVPETSYAATRPGVKNNLFSPKNVFKSAQWSKVTGRLVTTYEISDIDMVFASYSTGYKSGGFDSLSESTTKFSPESTNNFEIGYKGIINKNIVANVSLYRMGIKDLQRSHDSKLPGADVAIPTVINEDRKIKGIEFDLRWAATSDLQLGILGDLISTDISTPKFYNAEGTLVDPATANVKGSVNFTMLMDYGLNAFDGYLNVHVDYVYVENVRAEEVGLEEYAKKIDDYFTNTKDLNSRISWSDAEDKIEVGLWAKNILDQRRVIFVDGLTADALGTPTVEINRGREIGIDFKYQF